MAFILDIVFRLHDLFFSLVGKNVRTIKLFLLCIAHMSLIGLLFPELRRSYGSASGQVLLVIMFLSSVTAITSMPLLRLAMGFRREAGIFMGYLAIVHGAGYFTDPVYFDLFLLPYFSPGAFLGMDSRLMLGLMAIILTFPLLLTSNAAAMRAFGSIRWKRIHMLAYPLLVLVVFHWFLNPSRGGSRFVIGGLQSAGLLIGYATLKYMAWKPESFSFIKSIIGIIGAKYGEYRLKKESAKPQVPSFG